MLLILKQEMKISISKFKEQYKIDKRNGFTFTAVKQYSRKIFDFRVSKIINF